MRIPTLKLHLVIAALSGLAMLTSCLEDDNPVPKATELCLTVNGEHYDIPLPASEAVNLKTLCTEFDADIRIGNATEFQSITIGGQPLNDGHCSLAISEISSDQQIEIAYTSGGLSGTVRLNTLNADIPEIEARGQAVIPGAFYLSFIYQALIMKYDNEGHVLFYRYDPTPLAGTYNESGYWDFKKHTFDGKTYYSYHAPDPTFADRAFTGYDPGMRILLNDHYQPVDTIHAKASLDGFLKDGDPLDGHDFYFFSPTHYIASASYIERQVNGQPLAVGYLQEVKDGVVVFDWWSTDHPEMDDWRSPIFDTSYDYVHFNSVQVLPDGNWFCSFRVLNTLVKIDRVNGTGDILWHISGNELPEAQSFYGQHYATLHDDNTLTLFDNGNGHDPACTRILRLTVNPDTGEVTGGGNILNPGGDYFTQACGAIQTFGDRFVVGWGWSLEIANNDRIVSEYDADGREIFGLYHPRLRYRSNSVNSSYRCVKYQ